MLQVTICTGTLGGHKTLDKVIFIIRLPISYTIVFTNSLNSVRVWGARAHNGVCTLVLGEIFSSDKQ